MNKSIPAFVLGLIFSIIGAIAAFVFWLVFVLVGAFSSEFVKTMLNIVPFINMIMYGIGFIGSIICLFKRKIGGIILIIASIISLSCLTTICIALKTFEFMFILFWIPAILILTAGLIALKKKS